MKSVIKYTLLTASRDWLFIGILLLVLLATVLSIFLGNTALAEQSTMAAVYTAGASRMIVAMGMILFVCFHVHRSFENKEIDAVLARPMTRRRFLIAYYLGFVALATAIILPVIGFMFLGKWIGYFWADNDGILLWGLSLYLEILVLAGFALFASMTLTSAVISAMVTFGFYMLSRVFGYFLIAINNPMSLTREGWTDIIMEKVLLMVGLLVPRLDMFAKSEWIAHGIPVDGNLAFFLASSVFYITFLLSMALFDLLRREF
jgi:ABC-type transport system involved in multi-copper enzyme maturation permease subunit